MKRILAGPHAVLEVLRASTRTVESVLIVDSTHPSTIQHLQDTAKHAKVSCELVGKPVVEALAKNLPHQGVVAITGAYPYLDFEGLLDVAESTPPPLIVVLDQVQDPQNLGAIMRSAHAFGAAGMLLMKDRAAGVTGAAVRSSVGASELLKTARVTNLVRALDEMRDRGYQVLGASSGGGVSIRDISWTGKCALVFGNESKGLRRLTARHCDRLFTIPLAFDFDSLNVSAAAAVALYEASKVRFRTSDDPAK
jgi:23S rRNA (guanosine2251-2'-O)-methyltransferase